MGRGIGHGAMDSADEMRGRRPDLALDFQGLLRTALIGRASGARQFAGLDRCPRREHAGFITVRSVPPKQARSTQSNVICPSPNALRYYQREG